MKLIRTIIILIFGLNYAMGQSYKTAFKTDMCNCLEEESLKRKLTKNALKACLFETLPKYGTQIDAEIVEEDINVKYQKGQLARKDLLVSMHSELIYSCEAYYNHINYERNSKKLIAREKAKESDLEKPNQLIGLSPHAMSYFMRAGVYFDLGNMKAAEDDINKSLSLNPNRESTMTTRRELMLLAWVYEEQERYSEAVTLYDKIYFGDSDTTVAQLRALAHKKSGGTVASTQSIAKEEAVKGTKINTSTQPQKETRRSRSGGSSSNTRKSIDTKIKTTRKVEKKKDTASLRKLLKIGG